MLIRREIRILSFFFALSPTTYAAAGSTETEALELISRAATNIRGEYKSAGSSSSIGASGKAKAELRGLVKKLAALGIEGAASLDAEEYEGVLRGQLRDELADVRSCRLTIWQDLKDRLIGLGAVDDDSVQPGNSSLPNLKSDQLGLLECLAGESGQPLTLVKLVKDCAGPTNLTELKMKYTVNTLLENEYIDCRRIFSNHTDRPLVDSIGMDESIRGYRSTRGWAHAECAVNRQGVDVLLREGRI